MGRGSSVALLAGARIPLHTVLAAGIAASHACIIRVNPPCCAQFTRE